MERGISGAAAQADCPGADPDLALLLRACEEGDLPRVRLLWSRAEHPPPRHPTFQFRTFQFTMDPDPGQSERVVVLQNLLHVAAEGGRLSVIKFLVEEKKMLLGVMDSRGRSPLLLACSGAHTACAAQLGVESPAIVNLADRDGMTPFHAACAAGNVELIDLLHRRGADMNTTATQWVTQCNLDSEEECDVVWCNVRLTPFAAAVMSGSKAAVERLLSFGVDDKTPTKCFTHNCFCDFNYYISPLDLHPVGGTVSKPKRRRRSTPVKERAAKVGVVLPPTPTGLRDRLHHLGSTGHCDGSCELAEWNEGRRKMQRHQKACQQKVERAEMLQAKESAKYQRFCSRQTWAVTRHRSKKRNS